MKWRFTTVGLSVLMLSVSTPAQRPLGPDYDFQKLQAVLMAAKARVAPSIVTIRTFGGVRGAGKDQPTVQAPPGQPKKPQLGMAGFAQAQGATTGIIIGKDGWILISRFALNYDPSTILVALPDGRSFMAKRMGEDRSREIAVVKIDAEDLPVPDFVDPKDIRVGQWAFVLGRTFGNSADPSVHVGVVSATQRIFGRAVQVDAYTSPANYGGPIIDVAGRVLGISVPLASSGRQAGEDLYDSGIGFGATIADINDLLDRMRTGETLYRGYLGIATAPEFLGPGAKLQSVRRKSPAGNAKLRKGDTITAIDGVKIKNGFHLQQLVGAKMSGDPVKLEYKNKEGKEIIVTVFLDPVGADQMKAKKKDEEIKKMPWEELDEEKDEGKGEEKDDAKKDGDKNEDESAESAPTSRRR